MIFGVKVSENLTSKTYKYAHLTCQLLPLYLVKSKIIIFNNTTYTYFWLFALSQKDDAPAHCACDTVELLSRETAQFISPDMWPANSSDLSPVDYRI